MSHIIVWGKKRKINFQDSIFFFLIFLLKITNLWTLTTNVNNIHMIKVLTSSWFGHSATSFLSYFQRFHMPKVNFSLKSNDLNLYYNPGQGIWHKVKKSSKIGQDFENFFFNFAFFLTAIVKVSFLEKTLDTRLRLHPNLAFF